MSAYVLIPGAGGDSAYWSRVIPLLEGADHHALAVDLPGPDPTAGLPEYAERVVRRPARIRTLLSWPSPSADSPRL